MCNRPLHLGFIGGIMAKQAGATSESHNIHQYPSISHTFWILLERLPVTLAKRQLTSNHGWMFVSQFVPRLAVVLKK
jgi:hypothetical protein